MRRCALSTPPDAGAEMVNARQNGVVSLSQRVRAAAVRHVRAPGAATFTALSHLRPAAVWSRHSRLAAAQGLDRLFVILSFDCDTDQDIAVVEQVHARLSRLGITPAYAVPGELLERGADVYRRLHGSGAEFLNHGYAQHCYYDAETHLYISNHFYDALGPAEMEQDVVDGHRAVETVLGEAPIGFRTPHFGTFQSAAQLRRLWSLLERLEYRFSSSTMPAFAFRRGPAARIGQLVELPVSGTWDRPAQVMDSWSFRFAPNRRVNEQDYEHQMHRVLAYFETTNAPGIINVYADPSQVHDWDGFFAVMARVAPHATSGFRPLMDALVASGR